MTVEAIQSAPITIRQPGNGWFQRNRSIIVRRLRTGEVQLVHGERKLRWKELPERPKAVVQAPSRMGRTKLIKPESEHPWRRFGIAAGQQYRKRSAAS